MYLREVVRIRKDGISQYPFHMKRLNNLQRLTFDSPVTIFIGENGTGKTTFLESIVELTSSINLLPEKDVNNEAAKQLANSFKLIWSKKTQRGFYLKSQSFITYIHSLEKIKQETSAELTSLKAAYNNRSEKALNLASLPYLRTLGELDQQYGIGLTHMSHGEGYIELFKSRLVAGGLYILDEPELSLSPMRQLSLISMMKEMVGKSCQFIIITHSPILMAYEEAQIFDFNQETIKRVDYEEVEHVNITRNFLNNPKQYFRHL